MLQLNMSVGKEKAFSAVIEPDPLLRLLMDTDKLLRKGVCLAAQ